MLTIINIVITKHVIIELGVKSYSKYDPRRINHIGENDATKRQILNSKDIISRMI